jgi:O-antigen/teichoic acid export membrane protein
LFVGSGSNCASTARGCIFAYLRNDKTTPPAAADRWNHKDDLRRIDRGAIWTLVGNGLNLLPALLELVLLRRFGLGIWGEFLGAQAIVMVSGRVSCLGLDKAMLWYLPMLAKEGRGVRRPGWGAAILAAGVGGMLTLLLAWPLMRLALPRATDLSLCRWVVMAIPFFSSSEVFIGSLQGMQKFHYRPLLRDLGASAVFGPVALALAILTNLGPRSLGLGFLIGHASVAILSAWFWSRESQDSNHGPLIPKIELLRYSMPMWLADTASSTGLRASVILLSRLAAPAVVGAFGVIQSVWQTTTLARRAFESPIVAVTAALAVQKDLSSLFGSVVKRTLSWQIPIVLACAGAGGTLLHIISPRMGSIPQHLGLLWLVACSFAISGPALGQQVLAGLGKSPEFLGNTLLGVVATIGLLWMLVPRWGLAGACLAQGGSILIASSLGAYQLQRCASFSAFPGKYATTVLPTLVLSAACAAIWAESTRRGSLPWTAWLAAASLLGLWAALVRRSPDPSEAEPHAGAIDDARTRRGDRA